MTAVRYDTLHLNISSVLWLKHKYEKRVADTQTGKHSAIAKAGTLGHTSQDTAAPKWRSATLALEAGSVLVAYGLDFWYLLVPLLLLVHNGEGAYMTRLIIAYRGDRRLFYKAKRLRKPLTLWILDTSSLT